MRPDVRRWFDRHTSERRDWPLAEVLERKGTDRVSVVLPALNEAATIGPIIAGIAALAGPGGLVDEIVVMDSGSTDGTARVAAAAGADVVHRDDVLPSLGSLPGKGEVLWKSLYVTSGDLVVFVDADLVDFDPHNVAALVGPLMADANLQLVKAAYVRPLADVSPAGGGRATELVARPLLNLHWPQLAGFIQPLAGEYAGRRQLLEQLPFPSGYGVELGLLVDTLATVGLDAMAQVDLGRRVHRHQPDDALGRMASEIWQTALRRLQRQGQVRLAQPPTTAYTMFRRGSDGGYAAETVQVAGTDRPPMVTIPAYAARRARAS